MGLWSFAAPVTWKVSLVSSETVVAPRFQTQFISKVFNLPERRS